MTANERFEYMAERFYKKTGMLAPGKDDAIPRDEEYKQEVHFEWAIFAEKFYSNLFQYHAEMCELLETICNCSSVNIVDLGEGMTINVSEIEKLLAKARGES